jgi:hypothetical protein
MGADNTLDILVKLGVIGKEDVKAVNDLMKETGTVTEKSGDQVRLFSGEGREAHRVIGEINRVLPGTGNLFREAFNPTALGAVGILVGLVVEAKSALDAYNKSLDAAADRLAQPLDGGIAALQTAWDNATESLAKYMAELDTAGDKDPTSTMIKRVKELDDAQMAADIKNIESAGKVEVARIRAMEAGQDPSKIEADVERAQARTAAAIQAKKSGQSPAELQQELDEAKNAQAGLLAAAAAAAPVAAAAQLQAENAQTTLENLRRANASGAKADDPSGLATQGDIAAMEKILLEANPLNNPTGQIGATANKLKMLWDTGNSENPMISVPELEKQYAAMIQQKIEEMEKQKELQEQITASIGQTKQIAEKAKIIADAAAVAAKTNNNRIEDLPGQIAQAQAIAAIQNTGAATDAANKAAADAAADVARREKGGQSQDDMIASGVTGAADIQALAQMGYSAKRIADENKTALADQAAAAAGTGVFTDQDRAAIARYKELANDQEQVRVMNEVLAQFGANSVNLLNIMRRFKNDFAHLPAEILDLQTEMANLRANMNTTGP